jgi:hypothetical protein
MGLDMYLEGHRFDFDEKEQVDGFPVKQKVLELGYWRKHPNLHGYIVETFADGVDECQEIALGKEEIEKIMEAVKNRNLPMTTGFFFGESDGSEAPGDLEILTRALRWLKDERRGLYKSVYYRASW